MRPSSRSIAATALAVCVGYYLGANLGFILRFPPATPSVMWPPNAILTATLLLAPVRRWWIYLLAALPAHLVAEVGVLPLPLVLILFVTNCSEALVAAVCVRRFSDAPGRFDTLGRVAAFIVGGALFAPFVSSFADAAAVAEFRHESYWLVWRARFLSNVLTELTVVPAVVMVITAGPRFIRIAAPRRRAEAGLLALALVVVGLVVFGGHGGSPSSIPGSSRIPLEFLLPFILWATVRFGPGGASLSLLTTALIAIWAGTHGRGPFTNLPLADAVRGLQIFLCVVAIPIMCLAALIEERRRGQHAVAERLHFEELLSRLSGAFVHLPSHQMDDALATSLRRLGEFLSVDRVVLLQPSRSEGELEVRHAWAAPGSEGSSSVFLRQDFPWMFRQLLNEQICAFSRLEALPDEAAHDKDSLRRDGVTSNLTIPLVAGGWILGALAFVTVAAEKIWSDELVQRLRLVAEVFANALARKVTEDALRGSEEMKSAILASLSSTVAVLDRDGQIIAMNTTTNNPMRVGASYLESWRNAARQGNLEATEALAGIEAVLAGLRTGFTLEYSCGPELPCTNGSDGCWMAMSVVPLNRPERGAVVSHTDISERKQAEMQLQRSRQELAHFTRVSTMGELTASLAHELSQPLTGILTNAQAARRFLEATPPDLGELRNILSDIVDDDKRASEVLHRLRDFLRKGEPQRVLLDLNVLIRDVAKLLSSDAVIRNVTVTLDLSPTPLIVAGDRVQLQQVVMNLMINAMDAMADGGPDQRTIVLRSKSEDVQVAHALFEDTGTGLRDGTEDLIFEPFFTTKATGMGMGLSIAKSIVEAHGGLIWATNNPIRGATVHFALPFAGKSPP